MQVGPDPLQSDRDETSTRAPSLGESNEGRWAPQLFHRFPVLNLVNFDDFPNPSINQSFLDSKDYNQFFLSISTCYNLASCYNQSFLDYKDAKLSQSSIIKLGLVP